MREKTERLRALRLAREAGIVAVPPSQPDQIHAKSTKTPRKQTKKRAKVH